MLKRLGKVAYWLSLGLTGTSVLIGVVLAIVYHTLNPIIAWTILAAMIWGFSRMIRYIFTGK